MKKTNGSVVMILLVLVVASVGFVAAQGTGKMERNVLKQAVLDGDYETWQATVESYGKEASEEQFQRHFQKIQDMEAIHAAIENNDFAAWKQAMTDRQVRYLEGLTEEKFTLLVEMSEAKSNGDFETVKALMQEHGHGKWGMHKGFKSR